MNFMEHAAKPLLTAVGIAVPPGRLADSPAGAESAAAAIGPCAVKAQVPTGKRGKAGGIKLAKTPAEARGHAEAILGMSIAGHPVESVLVEGLVDLESELYAAVLNDQETKGPLILFSAEGGMDIEELAVERPESLIRIPVDVRKGADRKAIAAGLATSSLPEARRAAVADVLEKLYAAYAANDAELIEINPLAVTRDGGLVALDCKFVLDDSAVKRRAELADSGTPDRATALELKARELDLKFIEFGGRVGVIANGAGLTMTTMDAVRHYGGEPANFLEIGGESYRLGRPALELVLSNPNVKSLLVNFCGAFARTDVMTGGILEAWEALKPTVPVFFTIHGTGDTEAIQMVRDRLGIEPYDLMDDAVKAAVEAAK